MAISPWVTLAAAVAWGLATAGTGVAGDKPSPPCDAAIKAVLSHFEKHGLKLRKGKDNWWGVVDPMGEGYEVIIALRAFPAQATEQEMREVLQTINLFFMLNAPARVAMSKPWLRAADIEKMPSLDKVPVATKLEKLFKEYRPPESRK